MEISINSPLAYMIITMPIIYLLTSLLAHTRNNKLALPPGKLGWPFIGETLEFSRSVRTGCMERFITDRMNRYSPKVFKISLLGENVAVLCGPEAHKFIFSNENTLLGWWLPPALLKILLTTDRDADASAAAEEEEEETPSAATGGPRLSDFVKPSTLRNYNYVQMLNSTVLQHMEAQWATSTNSETISLGPVAKKLVVTLVCRLLMGNIIEQDRTLMDRLPNQLDIIAAGAYAMNLDLPGTSLRRSLNAAKAVRAEIRNVIRRHRLQNNVMSTQSESSHLFSATDGEGKLPSGKNIENVVFGALLAGYEISSALFVGLVYFLGHHPHVYERAFREQSEIRRSKSGEEALTWEDIKMMKYCRHVVNEVLRLTPTSIAGGFREVRQDISYEGFIIPKGWKILWTSITTHRDPIYFRDPQKFDPSRFERDSRVPNSFVPFGAGPMMCKGNEYITMAALLFMHNLLLNFTWEMPTTTDNIIGQADSLRHANKLSIRLRRRRLDATAAA